MLIKKKKEKCSWKIRGPDAAKPIGFLQFCKLITQTKPHTLISGSRFLEHDSAKMSGDNLLGGEYWENWVEEGMDW